jgi:Na+/H+ antiporter NhaD/arsenite permease-like protein
MPMETILISIFLAGYLAITLEHNLKINKAASALVTGVLCWTVYIVFSGDTHVVNHHLAEHLAEITGILFFLLGAMTIVELIDAHDGFEIILDRINTLEKRKLLWIVSMVAFFLSAVLDNLTTTIVMVSLIRKLIPIKDDRLFFAGMVVIASNAGGAWSPIGDVTTTMLWIGGQITAGGVIKSTLLPSLVCLVLPLAILSRFMKGNIRKMTRDSQEYNKRSTPFERNAVFILGVASLLSVPVFKSLTHLPPFMGMLLGLGLMWIITEFIHSEKDDIDKDRFSVNYALRKVDTPSILFFMGILVAVAALQSTGILGKAAANLSEVIPNESAIVMTIGLISAIVDNVPLVAATQGMYSLEQFPTDHYFWHFLAYCTGTGGSALIIGSAAGVAAMGLVKIDFFWYLKKITFWALLGYLGGAMLFIMARYFFPH